MQDSRAGGLINPITFRKMVSFVRTKRVVHLIATLSRPSGSARAQVAATSTQARGRNNKLKVERRERESRSKCMPYRTNAQGTGPEAGPTYGKKIADATAWPSENGPR